MQYITIESGCNTDMLEVLLIYPHNPEGAQCPRESADISVTPLAAKLQPINIVATTLKLHNCA